MFDHTPYRLGRHDSFQSTLMAQANDRAHRWLIRCSQRDKRIAELEDEVRILKERLDQA